MPLDTILCLDSSGSMQGKGMTELKNAVKVFLDGVEETARQHKLTENVAIVEFGKNTRIVHALTNNYFGLRLATLTIEAGGTTPMFDGLMWAMKEILQNGGIVRVMGRPLTPRIILMTDGKPTDEHGYETEEAKKKVLAAAASFGPGWKDVGLPHPIPIACVGCGACDPAMLEVISRLTNGMFVVVEKLNELSGFFRRQVLLIRFAAHFSQDISRLRNTEILREFLEQMGEEVGDAELQGLMRLLLSMMGIDALTEAAAELDTVERLPALGSRVRRGKDWRWGNQDDLKAGTVVEVQPPGVVKVEWDNGHRNNYRFGAEKSYDLRVVDEPRRLGPSEHIRVGVRVRRGMDWEWGDQDGGAGKVGVVYEVLSDHWVRVRWMKNGDTNLYRFGADNKYDLEILGRLQPSRETSAATTTATKHKRSPVVVENEPGQNIPESQACVLL